MRVVIVARTAGWALVGAAAGICPGVVSQSQRRTRQGAIGGALGGGAGGLVFDAIGVVTQAGDVSRLVGFVMIGAAIGALVGLIEEAGKQFWLTVLTGAREGRSVILGKAVSTIGRNEMADVPLFGDPVVQRAHAAILVDGAQAAVRADGAPVLLNGQPVMMAALSDGDILGIGRHRIRFNARAGAPQMAPRDPGRYGQPAGPGAAGAPTAYGPIGPPFSAGAMAQPPGPARTLLASPLGAAAIPLAPGAAAATLTAVSGPHAGAAFPLFDGAIAGRDPRCDIALLSDTLASRQHARFLLTADGWAVEDGGSTNGTYVNGQRVTASLLQPGDEVTIGGTVLWIG
ncbi:MAG TPA: FHA domain-containing protein, partial [Chthonomonadaceae bacterium]|nr:FHA domain-containing protein [Chthonomonadaceae bacterium]